MSASGTQPPEDRHYVSSGLVSEIEGYTAKMLETTVSRVGHVLKRDPMTILQGEYFDQLYSVLRSWPHLEPDGRDVLATVLEAAMHSLSKGAEAVRQSEAAQEDAIAYKEGLKAHRCAFKMTAYLLWYFFMSAEKDAAAALEDDEAGMAAAGGRARKRKAASQPNGKSWATRREQLLGVCSFALEQSAALHSLWNSAQPEEDFLRLFSDLALRTLDSKSNCGEEALRLQAFQILAALLTKYGYGAHLKPELLNAIRVLNHVGQHWVGLIECLVAEKQGANAAALGAQFISTMLTSINLAELSADGRDTTSIENTGKFFGAIAEAAPTLLMNHLSELHRGLSNPEYRVRNFVLETFGRLYQTQKTPAVSELLLESIHDQNAQVRSKVTKVWSSIAESGAIPIDLFAPLSKMVVGRIEDSASNVRKGSLALLCNLMRFNPFGANLSLPLWAQKQRAIAAQIEEAEDPDPEREEELNRAQSIVEFIQHLHTAVECAMHLLSSSMPADVQSAIKFFCTAKVFISDQADRGLRKMTSLIWSTDESVVKALLDAYRGLYFSSDERDANKQPLFLAIKLVQLPQNASVGELESLGRIFAHPSLDTSLLAVEISRVLWAVFNGKVEEFSTLAYRKGALIILVMLHRDGTTKTAEQLQKVLSILEEADLDLELAYWCLLALQQFIPKKDLNYRVAPSHSLCRKVAALVLRPTQDPDQWLIVAEAAIDTLFLLSESPDALASEILDQLKVRADRCSATELLRYVFVSTHVALKYSQHLETIKNEVTRRRTILADISSEQSASKKATKTPSRGRGAKAAAAQPSEEPNEAEDELAAASNATQEERDEEFRIAANMQIMRPNSLIGAGAAPLVIHLCLLTLKSLMPAMVESLTADQLQYSIPPLLQRVASIGLSKLMLIDQECCERHLQLLFTLLQVAPDPLMRANLAIAIGDLFMNHPNSLVVVKPNRAQGKSKAAPLTWTERLFSCLRDPSVRVRRSGLMIVNRLVLKEMIKVRELMHHIAKCLLEEDSRIVSLARHFFWEQSKRNELANAIPAIVTNLSTGDPLLAPAQFQEIIRFLFSQKSLETERQSISFLSTFCDRLNNVTDKQESWNYAFCVSSLHYTEKVLRHLIDNFKQYSQKLIIPEVYQCFQSILSKARGLARTEDLKVSLEDWEKRMTAAIGEGPAADQTLDPHPQPVNTADESVLNASRRPPAAKSQRGGRGRGRGRAAAPTRSSRSKRTASSSEDELEELEEEVVIRPHPARRPRGTTIKDAESDDGPVDQYQSRIVPPTAKRPIRGKPAKKIVEDSSSDEEGEEEDEAPPPVRKPSASTRSTRTRR
ncbi:MAG: hypothetical protein Q8P67_02085 [archaeon]|nr:hypothetical protein [archaeon]